MSGEQVNGQASELASELAGERVGERASGRTNKSPNPPRKPGQPSQPSQLGQPGKPGSSLDGPLVREVTAADLQDILDLSRQVPVVLDMWAPWCAPCRQLGPILEQLVDEYEGKIALGKVNVDEQPELSEAFQVQSIPAVFLALGGKPAPLFTGALPAATLRDVFDKILELAAKEGITSRLAVAPVGDPDPNPETPALPEALAQAAELVQNGRFGEAVKIYTEYLRENPAEESKVAPLLARARLGERVEENGAMAGVLAVERAKTAATGDIPVQLAAADAEFNSGDSVGALSRLLAVVAQTSGEDREAARARIVEYFEILGDDPIVAPMRARLSTLLY